jgi:hypothetical protein
MSLTMRLERFASAMSLGKSYLAFTVKAPPNVHNVWSVAIRAAASR